MARTRKERKLEGDPRKSVTERYKTREDYISQVTESVDELRKQRFILDEDHAIMLKQAKAQWSLIKELKSGELRNVDEIAETEGANLGPTRLGRTTVGDGKNDAGPGIELLHLSEDGADMPIIQEFAR